MSAIYDSTSLCNSTLELLEGNFHHTFTTGLELSLLKNPDNIEKVILLAFSPSP